MVSRYRHDRVYHAVCVGITQGAQSKPVGKFGQRWINHQKNRIIPKCLTMVSRVTPVSVGLWIRFLLLQDATQDGNQPKLRCRCSYGTDLHNHYNRLKLPALDSLCCESMEAGLLCAQTYQLRDKSDWSQLDGVHSHSVHSSLHYGCVLNILDRLSIT